MVNRNGVPPRAVLAARKRLFDTIRKFFDQRHFLEVDTPIMVESPGLEPHLEAFSTVEIGPDRICTPRYLHTSPEYAMKRLLAQDTGHIYQLARVFRNGERSSTHIPEFTMLEWYRSPGSLQDIMQDTEALLVAAAEAVDGPWRLQGCQRLSMSEAFLQVGLPDPLDYPEVDALRRALNVRFVADDTWNDVFHRAFLERVEPSFPSDRATLLHGFPASMAALARLDPHDCRKAERFEVYVGSVELANAFGELTDPQEQRRRFEVDLAERAQLGRPAYPIDEAFLADLENIDEAAGIALGVDRLLMLCLMLPCIQDAVPFSPRD
ncbi:MAG: EF-P lysine aminoacylase EpmA [Myxococcota bacterium]